MHFIVTENSAARGRQFSTAVALLCLAVAAACTSDGPRYAASEAKPAPSQSGRPPRTNLPMPPIAPAHDAAADAGAVGWTMLDGRRAKLDDYRGQVVVLDLYATYCPPCLQEIPHLVSIQRHYGSQGLSVIGLNAGDAEDRSKVPQFVEQLGIQYQLGNPDDQLVELLSSDDDSIPKTFVFDRRGRLVRRFTGFDDEVRAGLDAAIQTALGSKAD